jgi:hypothetical protein
MYCNFSTLDFWKLMKLPKELEFLLLAYRMVIYTIRQGSEFRHHNNILPYLDKKHLLHDASQYKWNPCCSNERAATSLSLGGSATAFTSKHGSAALQKHATIAIITIKCDNHLLSHSLQAVQKQLTLHDQTSSSSTTSTRV